MQNHAHLLNKLPSSEYRKDTWTEVENMSPNLQHMSKQNACEIDTTVAHMFYTHKIVVNVLGLLDQNMMLLGHLNCWYMLPLLSCVELSHKTRSCCMCFRTLWYFFVKHLARENLGLSVDFLACFKWLLVGLMLLIVLGIMALSGPIFWRKIPCNVPHTYS